MTFVLGGGTLVTALDPVVVGAGDVVVEGDRILAVGAGTGAAAAESGARWLDCTGCLVMPGLVNAHTHLYSALARGMPYGLAPPRTFVEILRRVWWRLDRALDAPAIRASALVGGMEALLAGTTTLVDHHASPAAIDGSLDVLAEALAALGARAVLAYEVTDRDGPKGAIEGLRENRRFAGRVAAGGPPLIGAMTGAHASFSLSRSTLEACVGAARETATGLHVHVAEDAADEADARKRFGTSVVGRLADAGALDAATLLAHGVHLDRAEAERVRESGATVAHNPRSNMNNAVGRAPLATLGDRVALGTDGIGGDMIEESRVAWLRAREDGVAGDPAWTLARLAEGARFAGRALGETMLGRVEPGGPADLVVLAYGAPAPLSTASFAGHWGFGIGARHVRDVVVGGRLVVRDGRLATMDQDRIVAEARVEASRLWTRLETIAEHPFDPATAGLR